VRRTDASRILGERYELQRRLGSGGAGTVWRAHDHTLGRGVAIKLLHADLADDPAVEARFRTEATAAARLTHPNAVQVYDVGRDDHDDYLVMELVEGPSLAVLLRDGPLPPGTAAAVGSRVAAALGAAHEAGIVHRDVKPANVLLSADGRIKLADFGIARVLGEASARLTRAGTLLGTARYLAPEQLGDDPVDARADVYALGLVLYEALTGQQPFGDGSPVEVATRRLTTSLPPIRELAPEVPSELQALVERATNREPDQRPEDGRELASALAVFASDDAVRVLAKRVADHARSTKAEQAPAAGPATPHRPAQGPPPDPAPSTRAPREVNAPGSPAAAPAVSGPSPDVAASAQGSGPPTARGTQDGAQAPTTVSRSPHQRQSHGPGPAAPSGPAGQTAAPDRTATMSTLPPSGEPPPPSV
jgi:eukaryotic-like serine/threonine-protein kinase